MATRDLGDGIEIRVRDNGIGMSPDVIETPAAVAWLDRRGDLKYAPIIAWPGERTDRPRGDVDVGCEKPMQREAGHDDVLAGANASPIAKIHKCRNRLRALEQGEIILGVDTEHFQSARCVARRECVGIGLN